MIKYIILTLTIFLLSSCSTIKNFKKDDSRIIEPKRALAENRFIRSADGKLNPEKQVVTPKGFTIWTIFTGTGSLLLFQFLKWKHIV